MNNATTTIRGRIEKVFYAGPTFSAGRIETDDGQNVSFAGNIFATEGQSVALAGQWEKHPKFGRQFKVEHVEIEMPRGADGLAQYLANHPEVKGIGPAKARKIVQAFGDTFDEVLVNEPQRVAKIAGVAIETINNLRAIWLKAHHVNAAMTWLSAFGLTHHQVTTLVEKLGNNVLAILQDDPYRVIREIKGLAFKKVDQIARKMGTNKEHPPRIRAGILHCVHDALGQGDCWVESEDLIDRSNVLLIMDCLDSRERIERELDTLIDEGRLECADLGGRFVVALPHIRRMELGLAQIFARAQEANPHFDFPAGDTEFGARYSLGSLNEDQRAAVLRALSSRISLISGGAGTGKTYTVSTLSAICEDHDLKVVLAAPTGKAAKRLQEASGREGTTIHRLLGYDGKSFAKGPDDPVDADVLIVDECFDYRQPILTEHGWEHIGKVVNQQLPVKVWARNPQTGQLELKPIIRWLKRPAPDELLNIQASRTNSMRNARQIQCTGDHKILTPYGYRRASDLRPGEEIIVRGVELHPQQRSILIGSLLGDGCMGKHREHSPQVTLMHGNAQLEYLLFKKKALGAIAGKITQGQSGYGGAPVWRLALRVIEDTHQIAKEMITSGTHSSGQRCWAPTNQFLQWIDQQALAIWYLDNGSLDTRRLKSGGESHYATIHTQRFSYDDNIRLAVYLSGRFGIYATVAQDSKGYWFLRFNKENSERFFSIITPFVPSCMEYKIPGIGRYQYDPTWHPETCIARIDSIDRCKPTSQYVFDIEVADYHNYIAGNIVVSNCSMVDVPLAWHLFEALDLTRTAVVLVGDHNQLPPVGPGNILRDLIQSRAIPMTILERCVRQAGVLKENSAAILAGEVRKTSDKRPDGRCDWYLVDQFTDPSGVAGCLREMFSNVLEEKLGFDLLRDVQVLTPTHNGPIGTKALNEELQRLVQRKLFGVDAAPHVPNRRPPLLKGDKIIQTRNNYDLGVMNGTVGFVRDVREDGTLVIDFDGETVEIEKGSENLRDIQLAYALTCHKAQGSEYPCAIVIVHKSHSFMHHRNLFYTGVTRARRTAIILGDRWGVRNCAERRQVDARKTFLSQLLHEASPIGANAL